MKYFKLLPLALVLAFVFACSSETASTAAAAPAAPKAPAAPTAAAAATHTAKAQVQPVKPTVGAGAVQSISPPTLIGFQTRISF